MAETLHIKPRGTTVNFIEYPLANEGHRKKIHVAFKTEGKEAVIEVCQCSFEPFVKTFMENMKRANKWIEEVEE